MASRLERIADSRRLNRWVRRIPGRLGLALSARLSLVGWRELDEESWPALRPGDDELLQSRLVWVAEIYGPSDVAGLLQGLTRLGIDRRRWSDGPLGDRVLEHRRQSRRWSHHPLGLLRRQGEAGWFGDQTELDLPEGVLAAMPTLTMLPGSMLVLVVAFLFDEDAGASVDAVVRRDYRTQPKEATRRHLSYSPPETVQREAVHADLKRQRLSAQRWMAECLPGAFARRASPHQPTAQLLTYRTDDATKFDLSREWPLTIDIPADGVAWRATKWPALRLEFGQSFNATRGVLRLFARENDLLPTQDRSGRDLDESEAWFYLLQQLGRSLDRTLTLHAISEALDLYYGQLADIRDLRFPAKLSPRAAGRQLRRIRDALEDATDARAVAADIGRGGGLVRMSYDGNDWTSERDEERPPLLVTMSNAIERSATDVLEEEERARDRLSMETEVFSAGASIRLQRVGLRVSVLALIAALAALGVALIPILS